MVGKKGQRGRRNWSSIREGYEKGEACSKLASRYGVHVSSLYRRAKKDNWVRERKELSTPQKKIRKKTKLQDMNNPVSRIRHLLEKQIIALDDPDLSGLDHPEKTIRLLLHITRALQVLDSLERTYKDKSVMDGDEQNKTESSKRSLKSLRTRLERRLNRLAARTSERRLSSKP